MATSQRPEVILGTGQLGTGSLKTVEDAKKYCELFHSYGHKRIDTARIYPVEAQGWAEELLIQTGASSWAAIDTKVTAMGNRMHSKESIAASVDASVKALQGASIDVMYLHCPDATTSLSEAMEGINEQYKQGKFRRLGLSNYSPQQVEEIVELAAQNGWCKPEVYQGQYNPVCRKAETTLLPVLRKHGISFWAFTPAGAGIFSGNVTKDSVHKPTGRFSHSTEIGKFWSSKYLLDELLSASDTVRTEAEKHGISGQAATLRWDLHHSALEKQHGDGMVIGGSNLEQLKENLDICDQGPLPGKLVEVINGEWAIVEPVAPWAWLEVDTITNLDAVGGQLSAK